METPNSEISPVVDPVVIERVSRFRKSSTLRFISSGVQLYGALVGTDTALFAEAAEELTDGFMLRALAVEEEQTKPERLRKARNRAVGLVLGAVALGTAETAYDTAIDWHTMFHRMENINFANGETIAALSALALNSTVYWWNRNGRKSDNRTDRFVWRDSIRDFVIPSAVIGLSASRAPLIAEHIIEGAGVGYGWYNTADLVKAWYGRRKNESKTKSS